MLKMKARIPDCSASATDEWPDLKMERRERMYDPDNEIVVFIEGKKVKVRAKDLLEAVERLQ